MDPITLIVTTLAGWLGVTPAIILGYIGVLVAAANVISRLIPDDATGWLHVVRMITKFIGVNVTNRVTSGVTQTDVNKALFRIPQIQSKVDDGK